MSSIQKLTQAILTVPDFPKPGIQFKDITPLFYNPPLYKLLIKECELEIQNMDFDYILAIESRGFLVGSPLAITMNKPLVLARKPGKLPRKTVSAHYDLEYGSDSLEVHTDDIKAGSRVLIIDDVLATGGTAKAAQDLIGKIDCTVAGFLFLMGVKGLNGSQKLSAPAKILLPSL